jgi:hypothetical protein
VPAPGLELDRGEELRATAHVSFRGAAGASARSTFALGSARMRHRIYEEWRQAVELAGFPAAGAEMILAVTNRRLLVCKKTFWTGRLAQAEGAIELTRIAGVGVERHGIVVSLLLVMTNNQIVEVETMRGRKLARFADAVRAVLPNP